MTKSSLRNARRYFVAAAILVSGPAIAQNQSERQDKSVEPVNPVEELRRAILERDQVILQLLQRVEALEKAIQKPMTDGAIPAEPSTPQMAPTGLAKNAVPEVSERAAALPELDEEEKREQERLVRTAFERTLIERGGLLLAPWTFELEPSASFIHSSSDQIVIDGFTILPILVVGDIFSRRIRRNLVQGSATARLGLPWKMQAELRVPFGHQRQRILDADGEEAFFDTTGLGDIEVSLSRELFKARGAWPDLLATVTWKTTTGDNPFKDADPGQRATFGTGFNSYSGALTAVKVADPLVFFGGGSYTYNDQVTGPLGRFNPGNTFGIQLGTALALNLNTSISFAYDQQFSFRSRIDGLQVPGSAFNTATLTIGLSNAISDRLSLDFRVGIGLTEDSPDMRLNLSFPFRF